MVLIPINWAEPNGSSKCRYRGSGLHMVIAPRAREASVQISLQFDRSRTVDSAAQEVQAAINEPVAPPSRLLSGSAASALPRLFCAPAQSSGSESGRLAISPP